MLRRITTAIFLLSTFAGFAQQPVTSKDVTAPADHHAPGTPLTKIKIVTFDTLAKSYSGKELKKINKKQFKSWGYQPETRIVANADLPEGKGNIFMMIFNPTCGHCEDITDMLKKNIGLFKESRLFLVTNAGRSYTSDFVKNHKTADFYPIMTVGSDSSTFIADMYLYGPLPQINIYSNERKLIKTFSGNIVMDSLTQYVN